MPGRLPVLKSIDEARARRATLIAQLQKLEVELGDRDRRLPSGERMHPFVYHRWRKQKLDEKVAIVEELRYVKRFIHEQSQPAQAKSGSRTEMLERLHGLVKRYHDLLSNTRPVGELQQVWGEVVRTLRALG